MGAIATVKPPFLLYFPFYIAAMVYWEEAGRGSTSLEPNHWASEHLPEALQRFLPSIAPSALLRVTAVSAIGLAVAPALCALYLVANDAWVPFLEMAGEYWPLYSQLNGEAQIRGSAFGRENVFAFMYEASNYMFPGIMAVSAFVALPSLIRRGGRERVEIWFLVALCVLGQIYFFSGGKFWLYHLLPLFFAYGLLVGFSPLMIGKIGNSNATRWLQSLLLVLLFVQALEWPDQADNILAGRPYRIRKDTEHVAELIREMAMPGDTAQPYDVTIGAVHAMLLAEIDIATPFLYSFHFYHHADTAINQRLRERMLSHMHVKQPRFIIVATPSWRPSGPNTIKEFTGFEFIMANHYRVVWSGRSLALLERNV